MQRACQSGSGHPRRNSWIATISDSPGRCSGRSCQDDSSVFPLGSLYSSPGMPGHRIPAIQLIRKTSCEKIGAKMAFEEKMRKLSDFPQSQRPSAPSLLLRYGVLSCPPIQPAEGGQESEESESSRVDSAQRLRRSTPSLPVREHDVTQAQQSLAKERPPQPQDSRFPRLERV